MRYNAGVCAGGLGGDGQVCVWGGMMMVTIAHVIAVVAWGRIYVYVYEFVCVCVYETLEKHTLVKHALEKHVFMKNCFKSHYAYPHRSAGDDSITTTSAGVFALHADIREAQLRALLTEAQHFAAEWVELRAVHQHKLSGRLLRTPLQVCCTKGGLGCGRVYALLCTRKQVYTTSYQSVYTHHQTLSFSLTHTFSHCHSHSHTHAPPPAHQLTNIHPHPHPHPHPLTRMLLRVSSLQINRRVHWVPVYSDMHRWAS